MELRRRDAGLMGIGLVIGDGCSEVLEMKRIYFNIFIWCKKIKDHITDDVLSPTFECNL